MSILEHHGNFQCDTLTQLKFENYKKALIIFQNNVNNVIFSLSPI